MRSLCLLIALFQTTPIVAQVPDVLKAMAAIDSTASQEIRFDLGDGLPAGGHLQGIQWIHRGGADALLLSGSSAAHSYFLTVTLNDAEVKPATFTKLLDSPFRHAGGIQVVAKRYVAVGLEDNHTMDIAKLWIVDGERALSDPLVAINRSGEVKRATAGAVAMASVGNRCLLIVGTWDSATLDVYWSDSTPWSKPVKPFEKRETWSAATADRKGWSDQGYGSYQNLNLIREDSGKLFLVGFCLDDDSHRMDLFEFLLDDKTPTSQRLIKRATKLFDCAKTSFKAGAGLRVLDDGSLKIYACSHREGVIEVFEN